MPAKRKRKSASLDDLLMEIEAEAKLENEKAELQAFDRHFLAESKKKPKRRKK